MSEEDLDIEQLWEKILLIIGENPYRPGLKDTPQRVLKMYDEIFAAYKTPPPKVTTFKNGQDGIVYDEMICDEGDFYSHCEHHIVTFFGQYYFAYIPHPEGKILGLSKVARVVDYFSSKLQIQERLTKEIVEYIWKELSKDSKPPLGMALIMKGEHLCKTMRGAKKKGKMTTSVMKGIFRTSTEVKSEFLNLLKL